MSRGSSYHRASSDSYATGLVFIGFLPVTPPPICSSVLQLHLDDARANGSPQCRVVALGLVGIGEREFAHRLVELGVLPEIPADGPGVTRLA
jgi:hypothetical protein